jgi:hypothetical protein
MKLSLNFHLSYLFFIKKTTGLFVIRESLLVSATGWASVRYHEFDLNLMRMQYNRHLGYSANKIIR